jgi:hypothetical protein
MGTNADLPEAGRSRRTLSFARDKPVSSNAPRRGLVQLVETVGYDTVRLIGSLEGAATARVEVIIRTDDFSGDWIELLQRFVETGQLPQVTG